MSTILQSHCIKSKGVQNRPITPRMVEFHMVVQPYLSHNAYSRSQPSCLEVACVLGIDSFSPPNHRARNTIQPLEDFPEIEKYKMKV